MLGFMTGAMLATAIIGLLPEALKDFLIIEADIALLTGLVQFFIRG